MNKSPISKTKVYSGEMAKGPVSVLILGMGTSNCLNHSAVTIGKLHGRGRKSEGNGRRQVVE